MPRPTRRTAEVRQRLLNALCEGATRSAAIAAAGIDQNTFYRWFRDDATLRAEVDEAKTVAIYAEYDRFLESLLPKPRPRLSDEEFMRRLESSAWGRMWLKEEAGTHHVVRVNGRRHFWRVPKPRRALCGARTRKGTPCHARCLPGKKRCRFHGGLSTGPRTPEGKARIAESNRRRAMEARKRAAELG